MTANLNPATSNAAQALVNFSISAEQALVLVTQPSQLVTFNGHTYALPPPKQPHPPKVWPKWACMFCGTNTTPERRAGPTGRNTLCNACGIKYSKKLKEEAQKKADEIKSVQVRMAMNNLLNND